ncbi:MAG: hypothetical protein JXB47_21005 [Anaerolineae bacterium]|nr:hypothetical protein [Anaerolineae bacterium]
MRKLTLGFLLVVLLVGALPAFAAVPGENLTALARYYPENTVVFAALRTDAGFVETLDGVLEKIGAAFPEAGISAAPLGAMLDETAQRMGGEDFETVFRAWMGDAAALGITDFGEYGEPAGIFGFAVADRAAAEAFVDAQFTQPDGDDYEKQVTSDYTLWEAQKEWLSDIVLDDDALLFFAGFETLPLEGYKTALADAVDFHAMLTLLPDRENDYSVIGYFNPAPLMAMMEKNTEMPQLFLELAKARGPYMVGMAVRDGRALVMDVAGAWGDTAKLEEAGFALAMDIQPADLGFASYVPADAPLVAQTINPGGQAQMIFDNIRAIDAWMKAEGLSFAPEDRSDPETERILSGLELGDLLAFANLMLKGMTGLEYEKDILPVMDGNMAAYLRFTGNMALAKKLAGQGIYYLPAEMAVVAEINDSETAERVTEAFAGMLEQNGFEIEREEIGGANMVVLPRLAAMVYLMLPGEYVVEMPELDAMFGWNGEVYVAGTRSAATFSLAPGESLADNPVFLAAQAYMLPGAQDILYLNPDGLTALPPALEALAAAEAPSYQDDVKEAAAILRGLFDLIESGSITAAATDNGDTIVRMVLTLAE